MGAGRKTETMTVPERSPKSPEIPSSSAMVARNLPKSELGGAIFGCKHTTMGECLSKQIFGLPSAHFSYVMNIEPGLPLFLFNYSDRKMHGIYEAASHGQLNIDPYAWTNGGMERTAFPAQVHIRIRAYCQPLTENKFKRAIKGNYYYSNHFYFELDHAQTKHLVALFTPFLPSGDIRVAPVTLSEVNLFPASPITKWKAISSLESFSTKPGELKRNFKSSSDLGNMNSFASLFSDDGEHSGLLETTPTDLNEKDFKEPGQALAWEDWTNHVMLVPKTAERIENEEEIVLVPKIAERIENEEEIVLSKLKNLCVHRRLVNPHSEGYVSNDPIPHEPNNMHENSMQNVDEPSDLFKMENTFDLYHGNTEVDTLSEHLKVLQVIKNLNNRTTTLEKKQVASEREVQQLRNVVMESEKTICHLQAHIAELETKFNLSTSLADGAPKNSVEQYLGSEKVIYLIGGFDGTSWLSSLDCFSPSLDILIPLKSMNCARSYASAAALNGDLYVFGGGDGNLWYNTVECYNRRNDKWTLCSPLIRPKGSLAGATLDNKLFAIGGGDGVECFSDVEMFDPFLGRWLSNQSMLQKRFAPAAAVLNGVLYAVGGYDGKNYLQSAEKYDSREGHWTRLPSMNARRGCHSMTVLNDKLYAIGGYDGGKMVPSIEIFDPRLGSWMMGEPMNFSRGYAATGVLDDGIFIIGGVTESQNIVGTVEYYKEGTGWTVTSLKATGSRCFFSAIVL